MHDTHIVDFLQTVGVDDVAYFSITYYQHFRSAIGVLPTWQALRSIIWLLLLTV